MMAFLWMILIGFLIGLVARFVMPGKDAAGFIVTTLLGIFGSMLGGWVFPKLGLVPASSFASFAMSVAGAVILLAIYRVFAGKRR